MKLETINQTSRINNLTKDQTLELQTFLSNLGLYHTSIDGIAGPATLAAWHQFKKRQHQSDPDLIGPGSIELLIDAIKSNKPLITRYHFDKVFQHARAIDREQYFLPLNAAMREFEINTLPRMAAFLAQVAHESASLRYREEIASGDAYEGRRDLGNVVRGDGRRFKGRGVFQLTGRANYRVYGQKLELPLETKPELAAIVTNGCRIAGLYWSLKGLNQLADQNTLSAFKVITRRINGGYNGLQDRLTHWNHARKVLGC